MPTFEFKSPEGKTYVVNGPEGSTQEEAWKVLQSQLASGSAKSVPNPMEKKTEPARDVTEGNSFLGNVAIGIGKGLTDVGLGAKQRFDEAAAFLEEKLGGKELSRALGMKTAEEIKQETQKAVDEKRAVDAAISKTGGGFVGEVIGKSIPATAAAFIPGGQSLAGNVITGAAMGAAEPTKANESALINAAGGAAGGAIGYGASKLASRVISPKASQNAQIQALKAEGVSPTIGQTLGGWANTMEQKLQSLPLVGDAITGARGRTLKEFNNAAINRALSPIGGKVSGTGFSAVKEAGDILSDAYEREIAKVSNVVLDNQFASDLVQLTQMSKAMEPGLARRFDKIVDDKLLNRVSPQGSLLSDNLKAIESELGAISRRYQGSSVASEQEFGDAVAQLKNLLNQNLRRQYPDIAQNMAKIDEGWANLVRIENAAKAAGNNSGLFTPAQLNNAIKATDQSTRKRAFSRGDALMQDLSDAGQNILGNKYPDSGTAGRLLTDIGVAGGLYALDPELLIGAGAGMAAYSAPMQKILSSMVTSRPKSAIRLSQALSKYAGLSGNIGAQAAIAARDRQIARQELGAAQSVDEAVEASMRAIR